MFYETSLLKFPWKDWKLTIHFRKYLHEVLTPNFLSLPNPPPPNPHTHTKVLKIMPLVCPFTFYQLRFSSVSCSVMSNSVQPHGLWPARLLCPWNSPGKNTGMGSQSLLQGFLLTQGPNLVLLHCRQILIIWATREAPLVTRNAVN